MNSTTSSFNPITGETIFTFKGPAASQVYLLGKFGQTRSQRIPMRHRNGLWLVRLNLPSGRHEYAFEADGTFHPGGIARAERNYFLLPAEVLQALAVTHTCFCHPHKWN